MSIAQVYSVAPSISSGERYNLVCVCLCVSVCVCAGVERAHRSDPVRHTICVLRVCSIYIYIYRQIYSYIHRYIHH
jgi:hypothetical protein